MCDGDGGGCGDPECGVYWARVADLIAVAGYVVICGEGGVDGPGRYAYTVGLTGLGRPEVFMRGAVLGAGEDGGTVAGLLSDVLAAGPAAAGVPFAVRLGGEDGEAAGPWGRGTHLLLEAVPAGAAQYGLMRAARALYGERLRAVEVRPTPLN